MTISQAPRRKSTIFSRLRRLFEVPISQAPKRNSKLNKGMWPKKSFCRSGPVLPRFDEHHE